MSEFSMMLFAAAIGAGMVAGGYLIVHEDGSQTEHAASLMKDFAHPSSPRAVLRTDSGASDIVLSSGLRIGPMKVLDKPMLPILPSGVAEGNIALDYAELDEPEDLLPESKMFNSSRVSKSKSGRSIVATQPVTRLHSNPGWHAVKTARRMIAGREAIKGSCYRYLSEVYERAGHGGWRTRSIVYREGRNGPYANLNLVRPGDWLYIVTDSTSTPVRTHSVMFVGWEDKARGYAKVISHAGWGAPRVGRESTYDLSQTYRIIRPKLASK